MLNSGRSQNFQNSNFLHIFVAFLVEAHFPKGISLQLFQYEIRAIVTESLNSFIQNLFPHHIITYNIKSI